MSMKIDGEDVPEETGVRLEKHLAGCEPCEAWLREETERARRLRAFLQSELPDQHDFEEELLEAAARAGWDSERLRFRRRGVGRILGDSPWRNSLILIAAAALFLAVAGLAGWLFPPGEQVASPTQLDVAPPSILSPFSEGAGARVVPDAEGRPVEVRFARSRYRYQVLPAGDVAGNAAGDAARAGAGRPEGEAERSGLELDLELERVEAIPVRLTSWPYE